MLVVFSERLGDSLDIDYLLLGVYNSLTCCAFLRSFSHSLTPLVFALIDCSVVLVILARLDVEVEHLASNGFVDGEHINR